MEQTGDQMSCLRAIGLLHSSLHTVHLTYPHLHLHQQDDHIKECFGKVFALKELFKEERIERLPNKANRNPSLGLNRDALQSEAAIQLVTCSSPGQPSVQSHRHRPILS